MSSKFLSVSQTARELDKSTATIRRMIASGRLPAYQLSGRGYSVDTRDLQEYIAKSRKLVKCFGCGKSTSQPVGFFRNNGNVVHSCSDCLMSVVDHFSLSKVSV